jgi:hypothetical protein
VAQWSNIDSANGAPKWKSIATGSPTPNRGNTVYANTTSGAFINNISLGVFGTDVVEAGTIQPKAIAPGWNLVKQGTGGIVSITATNAAVGYVNTDIIKVSSPKAGGNASITFTTNSTGGSLVFNIANPGSGFLAINATANIVVTNSTGGTATGNVSITGLSAQAGGHAGRVTRETLVVVKKMANNSVSGGGSTAP